MNYENRKISAIYELWKMKMFVCNTQIMKTGNYLFAKHELKNRKMFTIHYENICLQYMNYENICLQYINYENRNNLQYMNYENMEMSVCKTWIMKIQNICL